MQLVELIERARREAAAACAEARGRSVAQPGNRDLAMAAVRVEMAERLLREALADVIASGG